MAGDDDVDSVANSGKTIDPRNFNTFQFLSDSRVVQEFSRCPFVLHQRDDGSPMLI